MFENRVPSIGNGAVGSGNTTSSTELVAAGGAALKNRTWVEHITLGAAGYATIKRATTIVSQRFVFSSKGTYPVLQMFESGLNEAINFDVTLDSAAGGGGVNCQVSFFNDQISS